MQIMLRVSRGLKLTGTGRCGVGNHIQFRYIALALTLSAAQAF